MAEQKSKRTKDIGTPNVKASANAPLLALIRIRGQTKIRHDIYLTLHMFHLKKKLSCVLVTATPSMLGMIHKVKDYVTWGPIDSETHKLLLEKRQTFYTTPDGKKAPRPVFHLHPPRGGFERKGTKKVFSEGGALGERHEKINLLIQKML